MSTATDQQFQHHLNEKAYAYGGYLIRDGEAVKWKCKICEDEIFSPETGAPTQHMAERHGGLPTGIDLDKIDEEKRAMLEPIRKESS